MTDVSVAAAWRRVDEIAALAKRQFENAKRADQEALATSDNLMKAILLRQAEGARQAGAGFLKDVQEMSKDLPPR